MRRRIQAADDQQLPDKHLEEKENTGNISSVDG